MPAVLRAGRRVGPGGPAHPRREGRLDDWIINGQKIWTSGAHYSDYGILITRTDPTVPKHKGLTMFFLSMKTPRRRDPADQAGQRPVGTSTRSISPTCASPTPSAWARSNDGWKVSLTTLMNERLSIGAGHADRLPRDLRPSAATSDADDGPAIDDRAVRSKLANWAVRHSGLKYTGFRAISALSRGERPGPENSIGKLVAGSTMQDIATFAADLQGAGRRR